jgi:L-aminopeptidase/D-esterase-like protein
MADTMVALRDPRVLAMLGGRTGQNTTIAVVATDALLSKAEASKLAQMAHDGLARTIRPVHTPFDGDTVFALATGQRPGLPLAVLGSIAADVLARAVERAVLEAVGAGGLPAARDLG